MLKRIIEYSLGHKLIILLFSLGIVGFGLYSLTQIPIGAVPDVTNNQVQVITTSRNLATPDVEKFLTYPVELEMANLPNVKEIRSVSKFGLSVVTVVFEDKMGSYLPRQLIAEKIKAAEERIPEGFGQPFMGPITTGLGEIYQYTIEVDSAHRHQYSLTDLRTIQDWIVKRQLSGIPGVVEVNTWGGHLKQYEVALDPQKLRSLNISVSDAFTALKENNSVAGGGYIEKANQAYFIRGEGLVASIEDIESIVIENRKGNPILIKDVADVGEGHATRFGAITGNGEGEKVLGQVMMLKGANSKAVIEAVKERVEKITPSLPPGITINPFLERSELIGRTTFTIAENLILGCLIVVFVVVLLLGNLRSGLVVASVIPLCLLFALSLMYIFGVDANLMSLGAIDFGIIIDGAVIIVEYIAFTITSERESILSVSSRKRQAFIDSITLKGAAKMMHSAVFGQLIIIIVFIPILSLVGVEGKMFRPMALVFCFALIGAMILCFTYVPVMASLFIKPSKPGKRNISARFISFLKRLYTPLINWALRQKIVIIGLALALLVMTGFLFSKMGGEFVPTLDEGDFVIQPVLKTGTSLSQTIKATTRMENILKEFPEVAQVVTRIGAAEVPTDPMSMEESDVIIKLRPKSQWTSAKTKDELADKFKEALSILPGIDYEFTQPIEMRFNELITGVRADLAIKIFGEDLDLLYRKAVEIERAIKNVEGAADISVEKVVGLPQMTIDYNRPKIAKYGLNVSELNDLITMGFAGKSAGLVFEGEKKFDLVVRFDKEYHQDLENIKNTTVQTSDGHYIPLTELAQISYTKGPAQISRDDTKRRIVIGVNVRNRDLESVVEDVQSAIQQSVDLPVGYTIDYGGQFENLRTARKRLMVAVPIALVLIFIMLYFAFSSVKEALLIFTAIPLSAVGGVVLLYLRDMPFSISAGVGFIALFGIAVLNGIVLIEEFKALKKSGVTDIDERVKTGTKNRLRPVLLTASAAALGFLPMAISTSAGAEVQRPLATVVIGGLISATLLTLVVLPVLYSLFENKMKIPKPHSLSIALILVALGCAFPAVSRAQGQMVTVDEAIQLAQENNNGLLASAQRIERDKELINSARKIENPELYFSRDNNNIAPNELALNVWGINQSLRFPGVYKAQKHLREGRYAVTQDEYEINKYALAKEVSLAYYEVVYWKEMEAHYGYLDSLFSTLQYAAERKYDQGETHYLEKLTAITKNEELRMQMDQIRQSRYRAELRLNEWIQSDVDIKVSDDTLYQLQLEEIDTVNHPWLQYYSDAITLSDLQREAEKKNLLPDLNASLFRGANTGPGQNVFWGFEFGMEIPLFMKAQKSTVEAERVQMAVLQSEKENYKTRLLAKYSGMRAELEKYQQGLDFYESEGRKLSEQTSYHASRSYRNGEIDLLQYVQLLENVKKMDLNYLNTLYQYNRTVINLNYIINEE